MNYFKGSSLHRLSQNARTNVYRTSRDAHHRVKEVAASGKSTAALVIVALQELIVGKQKPLP